MEVNLTGKERDLLVEIFERDIKEASEDEDDEEEMQISLNLLKEIRDTSAININEGNVFDFLSRIEIEEEYSEEEKTILDGLWEKL